MSRQAGIELVSRLLAGAPPTRGIPADLMGHTLDHLFGVVWQDPRLDLKQRSLITCAVLVATGREAEQHLHFRGARNLGIERGQLEALLTHVAHYAGWPVAVSAARILDEVWTKMDAEAAQKAGSDPQERKP
jgi:4-carboxymuconolactone decarboxylase